MHFLRIFKDRIRKSENMSEGDVPAETNNINGGKTPRSVVSGVTVEESNFEWKIENFDIVRRMDGALDSQMFEFDAGESIGLPSKWSLSLGITTDQEDDEQSEWVAIFHHLLEAPKSASGVFTQCEFFIKDKSGRNLITRNTDPTDMALQTDKMGWGCKLFKNHQEAGCLPLVSRNLVIHCKFRLYSDKSAAPCMSRDKEVMCYDKFMDISTTKLGVDFSNLRQSKIPCSDVKIITKDQVEFTAQKGILAARSSVFEAMFRSAMREQSSGVIEVPDISGKTMDVLLEYIYTGRLDKRWCNPEVLAEFTYAAGKYQFSDLLEFLDGALGKACDLNNVGSLLVLATNLSLKKAEADLLQFIKSNGVTSAENFFKVIKCAAPSESNYS